MDNENKDFQGTTEESEMQKKVREDIIGKIADAAAEIPEEIAAAEAADEEAAADSETAAETAEPVSAEEAENQELDEMYAEPPKEPKKVTITLSSFIMSLIGTAVIGALLLFVGMQIPGWIESRPEGKTAAKVDGTAITDLDMKYYIYIAANDYFTDNNNDGSAKIADYDWSQTGEDGKTAEQIVKDKALESVVGEVLIMNLGDKNGAEWDKAASEEKANSQTDQLVNSYGEELITLNAQAQGLSSIKQYKRKIVQFEHLQAVETDMESNPSKYYPEDTSVLNDYIAEGKGSAKHILIKNDDGSSAGTTEDGQEAAPAEDKRAKAEEILGRINNGEDFDALMNEFNEDTGETEAGYTFTAGEMAAPFEKAAFALKIGEVSDIVESQYGYHIIKRIPGRYELEGYLKEKAKIKTTSVFDKLSVSDILKEVDTAATDFQTMYAQSQQKTSK